MLYIFFWLGNEYSYFYSLGFLGWKEIKPGMHVFPSVERVSILVHTFRCQRSRLPSIILRNVWAVSVMYKIIPTVVWTTSCPSTTVVHADFTIKIATSNCLSKHDPSFANGLLTLSRDTTSSSPRLFHFLLCVCLLIQSQFKSETIQNVR